MRLTTSFIVSFDFSGEEDHAICIVGKQEKGKVNIINAFQDKDAKEIFDKLTTKDGEQHVRIE